MKSGPRFWRRSAAIAACVLALLSLPLAGVGSPAESRADDGCGVGMYYNADVDLCEPWVQAPGNYYVNPVPVPIPNFSACITAGGRRGRITVSGCVG